MLDFANNSLNLDKLESQPCQRPGRPHRPRHERGPRPAAFFISSLQGLASSRPIVERAQPLVQRAALSGLRTRALELGTSLLAKDLLAGQPLQVIQTMREHKKEALLMHLQRQSCGRPQHFPLLVGSGRVASYLAALVKSCASQTAAKLAA